MIFYNYWISFKYIKLLDFYIKILLYVTFILMSAHLVIIMSILEVVRIHIYHLIVKTSYKINLLP